MYDQEIIDTVSEKKLKNIFDGREKHDFSIVNEDSDEQKLYFAFQHYLIKLYLNNYKRNRCVEFLNKMYGELFVYPHLFYNSPLIDMKTINSLISNTATKKMVIDKINSYYNKQGRDDLLKKRASRGLTKEEHDRLYANLQRIIYSKDERDTKLVFDEITRIMDTDFKKLSDSQLRFYCQYASSRFLKYQTTVVLGKAKNSSLRGFSCKLRYIFINKDAFDSLAMMTKTVCHESRHSQQYLDAKKNVTECGFEFAQRELFSKYLDSVTFNSYHENYRHSSIEMDAENLGYTNAGILFAMHYRSNLYDKVRKERKNAINERGKYSFLKNVNGKNEYPEKVIVENMNDIIKNNPNELNNFPVLRKFYHQDGRVRSFPELIKNRIADSGDSNFKGAYNTFIDYGIFNGDLDMIKLNTFSKNEIYDFLQYFIPFHYRNKTGEIKESLKDEKNIDEFSSKIANKEIYYSPKQVEYIVGWDCNYVINVLQFIDDNFDAIVNACTYKKVERSDKIYEFISEWRDFTFDEIKNPAISNSKKVMEKIKEITVKVDKIIRKFNYAAVVSRLDYVPGEVRNMIIYNGKMTFDDYMKKVIAPKLDSRQQFTYNGKIISFDDYLKIMIQGVGGQKYTTAKGRK